MTYVKVKRATWEVTYVDKTFIKSEEENSRLLKTLLLLDGVRLSLCATEPLTGPLLKMLLMNTKKLGYIYHSYHDEPFYVQQGSKVLVKDSVI
jgi:hypothetical protein